MKLLAWIFLAACVSDGCTFTVSTDHTQKKAVTHGGSKHHKTQQTESTTIVNQGWIREYRALEDEHNYRLSNDEATPVGNDKYRVTKSMLEHFNALSKAPPPTPTP